MKREISSQKEFEERMAENLPNMVKDINLHIQEAHQTQNKITSKTIQIIKKNY